MTDEQIKQTAESFAAQSLALQKEIQAFSKQVEKAYEERSQTHPDEWGTDRLDTIASMFSDIAWEMEGRITRRLKVLAEDR